MPNMPCPVELVLPPMADVVEVRSLPELQSYRMAWNALLEGTPRRSFFLTFDWFELAWKHFGAEHDYRVLVIRSEGKPIGFVPLCVVQQQYRVGALRTLTYPLADWGAWYGPIGPDQTACYWLAMQHLASRERDWELLELRWIDHQQAKLPSLSAAMQAAGLHGEVGPDRETSVVDITGTWEDYLQTRTSKRRHEIRRHLRFYERHSGAEFLRHRPLPATEGDGQPRWELFEDCLRIAASSWQGEATDGVTLSHDRVAAFLRDCHAAAARLGMLDLTLLKLHGQPVAFGYNYHYQNEIAGLRMGYDPAYRQHGVGTVLLLSSLRDSFRRGDVSFDLGVEDYNFKHRYRTKVEQSKRITHYPPADWKSQGVRLTQWAKKIAASL